LADSIRQQRMTLEANRRTVRTLRDELNAHLAQLDQPFALATTTLADLLDASEDVARSIEASNQQRQHLADQIQQLAARSPKPWRRRPRRTGIWTSGDPTGPKPSPRWGWSAIRLRSKPMRS
jgi:chromosome segregation ATPase